MSKDKIKDSDGLPPLLQCTDEIKGIALDCSTPGSKHQAQLFTSCLGFLTHIQLDRLTIEQHYEKQIFPSPDQLPALKLLFQDRALFSKLICMLRSKVSVNDGHPILAKTPSFGIKSNPLPSNLSSRSGAVHHINTESRKRKLSFNGEMDTHSKKMSKFMVSPLSDKDYLKEGTGIGASLPLPPMSNMQNSAFAISANFNVIAAIILYSAFQYLDHWPAILVKAFAEDSFSQRIWVDDARCQLFVQNLSVILHKDQPEQSHDTETISASSADEFVKNFNKFYGDDDENCTQDNPPHKPVHTYLMTRGVRATSIDASKLIQANNIDHRSDDESTMEGETKQLSVADKITIDTVNKPLPSSLKEEVSEQEKTNSTRALPHIDVPKIIKDVTYPSSQEEADEGTSISLSWWCPEKVVLSKVRQRYFWANKNCGNKMVGEALSERLEVTVKQNWNLLSALPDFVHNPIVRKVASSNLEKWLQSPALSGLARKLFSFVVKNIENNDPPLKEDVETIENILSMKLNSNQSGTHVNKVIEIITNISSLSVCNQVIDYYISKEVKNFYENEMESTEISEELKMLELIVKSLRSTKIYKSFAFSLLRVQSSESTHSTKHHVMAMCAIVRSMTSLLGQEFDGFKLAEEIINCSHHENEIHRVRGISRLIFECVVRMVPQFALNSNISLVKRDEVLEKFSTDLFSLKTTFLAWFLASNTGISVKNDNYQSDHSDTLGQTLNKPEFDSILDGDSIEAYDETGLLDLLKCSMFLLKPSTLPMQIFLNISSVADNDDLDLDGDIAARINFCMNHGCGVDEKLLQIIVKSVETPNSSINAKMAISLIELMLYNCRGKTKTFFGVNNCESIWDLYELTDHSPKVKRNLVPRLACPGLWWRVTAIVLVLCGKSPHKLGYEMWRSSPTIQALIKMVTTGKFRFPTTDLSEIEKEKMREKENKMREKEFEIAEILFDPKTDKSAKQVPPPEKDLLARKGSRTSARQREKQERMLAIQREKERAKEMAELQRRKQRLKKAQKSIMIFDPKSEARKPRKEAVQLFFSINTMFNLSDAFKACKDPDYILLTIGSLTRDGIERAYDWLIPTISSCPNIINRLPPSASCFLLLRAYYGLEGNKNSQLLELSSPLLHHVSDSIIGKFGQEGVQRAAEILFYDLAAKEAGRRRCARRVLQESLGNADITKFCPNFAIGEFSWLIALTETDYKCTLVKLLYPHLITSLAFEKGEVLRAYVMALDYFLSIEFPERNSYDLPLSLCDLLSSRPKECVAAMNCFDDLAMKLINVVHESLTYQMAGNKNHLMSDDILVKLKIAGKGDVVVACNTIRASLVLIGNWKSEVIPPECKIMDLVNFLLPASVEKNAVLTGVASAMFISSKEGAIQIEDWAMLARSKCNIVAKRSILSTPDVYLPRLILCCGLPQSSFTTIIERLDRLGEDSSLRDKTFKKLLSSSMKGDLASLKRKAIMRMLCGRINAYASLLRNAKNSSEQCVIEKSDFISWLHDECDTSKDRFFSKRVPQTSEIDISTVSKMIKSCDEMKIPLLLTNSDINQTSQIHLDFDALDHTQQGIATREDTSFKEKIECLCREGMFSELSNQLTEFFPRAELEPQTATQISLNMISIYQSTELPQMALSRLILHWVPLLTKNCNQSFWQALFVQEKSTKAQCHQFQYLLLSRCLSMWTKEKITACQNWILNEVKHSRCSEYSIQSLVNCFLFKTSSIQTSKGNYHKWLGEVLGPREQSENAIRLALNSAKEWFENNKSCFWNKANEPMWVILLLQIGSIDKKHFDLITDIIVSKLPSPSWEGKLLPGVLLRLYASKPASMNVGRNETTDMLLFALNQNQMYHQWLEWNTPIDNQFCSSISLLSSQNIQKQNMLLFELSKKYPLIAIKHLNNIAQILTEDADIRTRRRDSKFNDIRQSYRTPLIAQVDEIRTLHVKIHHWGIYYTEPLWISILDFIHTLPEKIAFHCGWFMGLETVMTLYVKLLLVQIEIGNESQRLTEKFSSLVQKFQSVHQDAYNEWLRMKTPDFKRMTVKDLLCASGIVVEIDEHMNNL